MASQASFIVKLLIVSAVLSLIIKFAPISIPPTTNNVLIAVLLPTIVVAITLLSRYAASRQQDSNY